MESLSFQARDYGTPWPTKDIIHISVMSPVMLAALVEWVLFLCAFVYCLYQAFKKAEHWSGKVLAVIGIIIFCTLRIVFLLVMVVTLPLPQQVTQHLPQPLVTFLSWFAFYTFAVLLVLPLPFCLHQLIVYPIGRQPRIRRALRKETAPKCMIVMPCYNEDPDVLLTAINSVVESDYPPACLHVFLSFDGDQEDELFTKTMGNLGVPDLESYPKCIDHVYKKVRITVSRFPHGGKRKCQKRTFKLMNRIYADYLDRKDDLFMLFIDSDCILDKFCIQNFLYDMEMQPGAKGNKMAMTGIITSTTKKNSFLTFLQDIEYVHGQVYERTVESACGAVTCLPGALTMLRFSAFRNMAKYYFADQLEQMNDLFDYGKCHLGEDRWLTHLFMVGAKKGYQIQLCNGAFCKTEAVQTYKSLLKQRRRWFLGYITNEACMLTDVRLWRKYPVLCIMRLMQNTIRTTALLFFAMLLALLTDNSLIHSLPLGFIGVSLGIQWLLMIYLGCKLNRWKMLAYPVMFVVNPFFNWAYLVYGILTAGKRTWGGPRADAAAADDQTTPLQAIEDAEQAGDDLNVDLASFRPSEASHPFHPWTRLEGRFTTDVPSPSLSPLTSSYQFSDNLDMDSLVSFESTRSEYFAEGPANDAEERPGAAINPLGDGVAAPAAAADAAAWSGFEEVDL